MMPALLFSIVYWVEGSLYLTGAVAREQYERNHLEFLRQHNKLLERQNELVQNQVAQVKRIADLIEKGRR
jgi:hypothetical protein